MPFPTTSNISIRFASGLLSDSRLPDSGLPVPVLKPHLRRELKVARIAGACDRPEGRCSEAAVRIVEQRCVRHVEHLGAEFESDPFLEAEGLSEHQVGLLQARTTHRIPP